MINKNLDNLSLKEIYEELNYSELIDICLNAGIRVDCSFTKDELIQALLKGKSDKTPYIDELRLKMKNFFDDYPDMQAGPFCPRDCFKHPDLLVIFCYDRMQNLLKALEFNEKTIKIGYKMLVKNKEDQNDSQSK
jgi:hypothetical protein